MRPANIVTAWADILAGFAITHLVFFWLEGTHPNLGFSKGFDLFWLLLATSGLYGGGVVFNDVFDFKLDKIERPERALPSGKISLKSGILLGLVLLFIGIISAFMVNYLSGALAIIIALAALLYDKYGKHHPLFGPTNMGLCRGLNLMLGMSVVHEAIFSNWFISIIPILFIAAITMISRFEVSGGNQKMLFLGGLFFSVVISFILSIGVFVEFSVFHSIPYLVIFSYMVFKPLIKAIKDPSPLNIRASVRGGILGLIPMDAAIASGYAGMIYGYLILLLLPVSIFLAKKFAVT